MGICGGLGLTPRDKLRSLEPRHSRHRGSILLRLPVPAPPAHATPRSSLLAVPATPAHMMRDARLRRRRAGMTINMRDGDGNDGRTDKATERSPDGGSDCVLVC